MRVNWGVALLCVAAAAILIGLLIAYARRPPCFQTMSDRQLLAYIERQSELLGNGERAVMISGTEPQCDAACAELRTREPPTSTASLVCQSTYCSRLAENAAVCHPCDINNPQNCSEDGLLIELRACTTTTDVCEAACAYGKTQQDNGTWSKMCTSHYCASSRAYRDIRTGYCCVFPDVGYCKDAATMLSTMETPCMTAGNESDCIEACITISGEPEGWDKHGDRNNSTGACNSAFCYNHFYASECYVCNTSDREMCDDDALLGAIRAECDPPL